MTKADLAEAPDTEAYLQIFRALSEPVRLEMLRDIASVAELPCTILQKRAGLAKSTCSYHIKILHGANLISVRKQGRNYYYTANTQLIHKAFPSFLSRIGVRRDSLTLYYAEDAVLPA